MPSIRQLNPLRLLSSSPFQYDKLPAWEQRQNGSTPLSASTKGSRFFPSGHSSRSKFCKTSLRVSVFAIIFVLLVGFLGGRRYATEIDIAAREADKIEAGANTRYWEVFERLNGFYNGVKTLVPYNQWIPEVKAGEEYPLIQKRSAQNDDGSGQTDSEQDSVRLRVPGDDGPLPLEPIRYSPYPKYTSSDYLREYNPVDTCYLDDEETIPAPDIFVYPGLPQGMVTPFFGDYEQLGLPYNVCFERFGRLGPYGYGYNTNEGGTGLGMRSEQQGAQSVWKQQAKIDWSNMDWGRAQKRCYEKNLQRFDAEAEDSAYVKPRQIGKVFSQSSTPKKRTPRTAYVLRAWTGFEYTQYEILYLRSMINELSLKSGGEYDVHILLHVKDDTIPIWSSKAVYQQVIEENIPEEFWGITTLWSVQLMRTYYPGPFGDPPANIAGQEIHGVYRSAHFALQWFSQEHPEYDFFWNWEMDIRYSGQHYEFHEGVATWARQQPRRGLWERNEKFWIPDYHGDWNNFTRFVDQETLDKGEVPVWGPVEFPFTGDPLPSPEENVPPRGYFEDDFEWGVGEDADLITFNPIFNPAETNWVFRKDISGYDLSLPIPPRRCAIITVARLSRRLLDMMHEETYIGKHSAFPEMWPPTVALHHGMKAVYFPHPVYFDRKWPLDYLDQIYNYPENKINSPFGWGEHNWFGSSFYYNSGFSGALWRRWLGERENDEGGAQAEMEGSGRMCLRATLHHPIKNEDLPED